MATNRDIRQGLLDHNTGFRIMFEDAYNNADPGFFANWTERIDANGVQQITLAFLTNTPAWRKWTGAKQHKNLRSYTQTITYDKYEATMSLKRDMVDYDTTGVLGRTLQKWISANVIDVFDQFIAESMDGSSGAGPVGFDGENLYDTGHVHGPSSSATQSNLGAGSNLSHSTLVTAEHTALLWQEENGRPVRPNFNLMRVGPKLKRRAQELLSADRVVTVNTDGTMDTTRSASSTYEIQAASTRSSVWQGDMTLVVDPRVTTYYWDLHDTTKGYKPMILFVTRAPEPIALTDMTDPDRFNHDEYVYSVEADFGVAAGHWYATYRGTGTA